MLLAERSRKCYHSFTDRSFALLEVHTGRLDFPREENPCEYTARRETRERERVRAFHDFPVSRQEKERGCTFASIKNMIGISRVCFHVSELCVKEYEE
jgi:hypothetical protein